MIDLDHVFSYHTPGPDEINRYWRLREAAKDFAQAVLNETPPSADQSAAIRHIREALMTANASIALKGQLHPGVNS